ncbi:Aminopeptidase 2 mitochondrial [Steccherinum ochraceum]|uniref:Aminopeptidase n=1 Tax=Steccherinum ochraceum TaxID=92696 RepID=A0A4R0R274_9APHY|nr:Aminopeptidase 2 mitochondrial [Steccherinum ochraceum]
MSNDASSPTFGRGRLPSSVKPRHYDVKITTDLVDLTFTGRVKTRLDILEAVSTITFHSVGLDLEDPQVMVFDGDTAHYVDVVNMEPDPKIQWVVLTLASVVRAGASAQLILDFKGNLSGSQAGYCRPKTPSGSASEYYAFTQLAPMAARRVFPCLDEPGLKATFAISLITDPNNVNLSNMPVVSETAYVVAGSEKSWKRTVFGVTPPMSTYIVAFATGPFTYRETSYQSPISGVIRPVRVYATSDMISQAGYSLEVAEKALPLYEQFFDLEYPLPKFDTFICSGFDAGAVENWGLIIGSPVSFLLDPKSRDFKSKLRVAHMQAHETAHMWIYPDWDCDARFLSERFKGGLTLDSKNSSHPIEVPDLDIDNVLEIFDGLSYAKGASVLRMLSAHVGQDQFWKGVSKYLKDHTYDSTVTKDLWDSLSAVTGIDVSDITDNWVTKIGFPVLTVSETGDGIHIRQDRFLETGPAQAEDNETIWNVPLNILTAAKDGVVSVDYKTVLRERETTIKLNKALPYKLNANTSGFYRVLYTGSAAEKIARLVGQKDTPLSVTDRVGLILDAIALAKANFTAVSESLAFLEHFRNEGDAIVWTTIAEGLNEVVDTWWEHEHISSMLASFQRDLFSPIAQRLGFKYSADEFVNVQSLRTCSITQAALAGDELVIQTLKTKFSEFMKSGDDSNIPGDLQVLTYSIANKYGTRTEYDFLKQLSKDSSSEPGRIAALLGIGASEDLSLAEETWKTYVREAIGGSDVSYIFVGLKTNPRTRRFLAEKFREDFDLLTKKFGGNYSFQILLRNSHEMLSTVEDHDAAKKFFETKTLDTILTRAAWVERSTEDLQQWLEKRDGSGKKTFAEDGGSSKCLIA